MVISRKRDVQHRRFRARLMNEVNEMKIIDNLL